MMIAALFKRAAALTGHRRPNHAAGWRSRWTGQIVRGADALRRRHDLFGQTMRFPTGETFIQDNAGGLIIKDRHFRIIKVVDYLQNETSFSYDETGKLSGAITSGGSLLQAPGDEFKVLGDGTLRIATKCGATTVFRDFHLDGSVALIAE